MTTRRTFLATVAAGVAGAVGALLGVKPAVRQPEVVMFRGHPVVMVPMLDSGISERKSYGLRYWICKSAN